jgi:hypothetical protein
MKRRPKGFQTDLARLLDNYSLGADSDSPNYVLAQYLTGCLDVFNMTMYEYKNWHSSDVLETPKETVG